MSRENEKVHTLLMQRADQVRQGAEILIEKTRDWQIIKEFMSNRHAQLILTEDQERKLERYKFIYDQKSSGKYTNAQIVSMLMNIKMYGISLTQAYEDIRYSAELFSATLPFKRNFELNNELEIAKAARAKCLEVFDFKNAAAFSKVIKDLIALLPEEDEHPGLDFEGHTLEGTFDPKLLGAPDIDMKVVLKVLNEKRKVPIKTDMFDHLIFEETNGGKENTSE